MIGSDQGNAFTKAFESCRLTPYQDEAGVWTNGWGNTHDVDPDVEIMQEQADADFLSNMGPIEDALNNIAVEFTQPQFDSLRDFAYNEGISALQHSTLLAHIEGGGDIAGLFELWDKLHQNGQLVVSAGLLRRRKAEDVLYSTGDYGVPT